MSEINLLTKEDLNKVNVKLKEIRTEIEQMVKNRSASQASVTRVKRKLTKLCSELDNFKQTPPEAD